MLSLIAFEWTKKETAVALLQYFYDHESDAYAKEEEKIEKAL